MGAAPSRTTRGRRCGDQIARLDLVGLGHHTEPEPAEVVTRHELMVVDVLAVGGPPGNEHRQLPQAKAGEGGAGARVGDHDIGVPHGGFELIARHRHPAVDTQPGDVGRPGLPQDVGVGREDAEQPFDHPAEPVGLHRAERHHDPADRWSPDRFDPVAVEDRAGEAPPPARGVRVLRVEADARHLGEDSSGGRRAGRAGGALDVVRGDPHCPGGGKERHRDRGPGRHHGPGSVPAQQPDGGGDGANHMAQPARRDVGHEVDRGSPKGRLALRALEGDPPSRPGDRQSGLELDQLRQMAADRGDEQHRGFAHSTTRPSSPSSGSGHAMSRPSRVCTMISLTSRLRNHLRSAGTTYQGAWIWLVRSSITRNASW